MCDCVTMKNEFVIANLKILCQIYKFFKEAESMNRGRLQTKTDACHCHS